MMPRMRLVTLVLVLTLIGAGSPFPMKAAVPARHAAQTTPQMVWQIVELDTMGGEESLANALNDAGQIVGIADNVAGEGRAVLWENGEITNLGTRRGQSNAAAINDAGQIIGFDQTATLELRAVLWVGDQIIDLGVFDGFVQRPLRRQGSQATGINAAGQIVGYAHNDASSLRAVLWESSPSIDVRTLGGPISGVEAITAPAEPWELADLGTLGGSRSGAYAINDASQIVGSALNDADEWRVAL